MERYKRAYRDPSSPLTPLTPLSSNVFDFNIDTTDRAIVRANNSPISAGLEMLGSLFQRERGHRLGTGQSSSVCRRRTQSYNGIENMPMAFMPENSRRPVPPLRQKRNNAGISTIKHETIDDIPKINIVPPPRRKRKNQNHLEDSTDYNECNVMELSADMKFVRHQQQQLKQYENEKKRRFDASNVRLSSPVSPKPLSPRLGAFLCSWGLNCLKSIFERQEIDMQTFLCLTANDLELLGIEDRDKQELVLKSIDFLKNNLKRE